MHTRRRDIRSRLWAVVVALAVAVAGSLSLVGTASAQEPPRIEVALDYSQVFGWDFSPDAEVQVVVRDSEGGAVLGEPVIVRAGDDGTFATPEIDDPSRLEPGMFVTAGDGMLQKELTIADVSIDGIDPPTERVWGTAPDGPVSVDATYGLWPDEEVFGFETTAVDGQWSFAFPVDVDWYTQIGASVADEDGDTTRVEETAFHGEFQLEGDALHGEGYTSSDKVTVRLYADTGDLLRRIRTSTTPDGTWWVDLLSTKVLNVTAGMRIVVVDEATGATTQITVQPFSIDTFDRVAGVVTGSGALPGQSVMVYMKEPPDYDDEGLETIAAPDGTWSVDYGRSFPRETGVTAWLHVAKGAALVEWYTPPAISADLTTDTVSASGLAEAVPVEVMILSGPGGDLLASASVVSDGSGAFELGKKRHHVDLVPGMHVVVDDGTTRDLTLVDITITSASLAPFGATGTAPPGADVLVGVALYRIEAGGGVWTVADDQGSWSASTDWLTPDKSTVSASTPDAEGDSTQVTWVWPKKPKKN